MPTLIASDRRWTPKGLDAHAGTAVARVDNRAFVLGLNELYRDEMKQLESYRLLPYAQAVATKLHMTPGEFPIEGYYSETPKLKEYFNLMRTLQSLDEEERKRVKHLPEFQFLDRLTRSCIYGRPDEDARKLLPRALDPLALALKDCAPDWNVDRLMRAAYEAALRYKDFSLVGLASRTRDPIAVTATRESSVLYAEVVCLGVGDGPEVRYEWAVDDALAEAANRFIAAFNGFVRGALPRAEAANAKIFYESYAGSECVGRCVRIGMTPEGAGHYHWAVAMVEPEPGSRVLEVDEFWSQDVWTTESYRQAQGDRDHMRLFAKTGVPGS